MFIIQQGTPWCSSLRLWLLSQRSCSQKSMLRPERQTGFSAWCRAARTLGRSSATTLMWLKSPLLGVSPPARRSGLLGRHDINFSGFCISPGFVKTRALLICSQMDGNNEWGVPVTFVNRLWRWHPRGSNQWLWSLEGSRHCSYFQTVISKMLWEEL